MANGKDTPEWYVESGGTRKGPYTIQQIEALKREGKFLVIDRVTSPYLGQQSISVGELLEAEHTQPKDFNPPPRPEFEPLSPPSSSEETASKINPALSLFDTLQAARDRKPKSDASTEQPSEEFVAVHPGSKKGLWLFLGLLVLGIGIWALSKRLGIKTPDSPPASTLRVIDSPAQTQYPVSPPPPITPPPATPPRTVTAPRALTPPRPPSRPEPVDNLPAPELEREQLDSRAPEEATNPPPIAPSAGHESPTPSLDQAEQPERPPATDGASGENQPPPAPPSFD